MNKKYLKLQFLYDSFSKYLFILYFIFQYFSLSPTEKLREPALADRSWSRTVFIRENGRNNRIKQHEVRDQESHNRAHGRRDSRVGMPKATC